MKAVETILHVAFWSKISSPQVHDYFATKKYQLFNYQLIPGAPSTNNFEESRYHVIKHHMQRTIGQLSAKEYLARHGIRLFFVNIDAKLEEVETILKSMDQTKARKELDKNVHPGMESIL